MVMYGRHNNHNVDHLNKEITRLKERVKILESVDKGNVGPLVKGETVFLPAKSVYKQHEMTKFVVPVVFNTSINRGGAFYRKEVNAISANKVRERFEELIENWCPSSKTDSTQILYFLQYTYSALEGHKVVVSSHGTVRQGGLTYMPQYVAEQLVDEFTQHELALWVYPHGVKDR